MKYLIMDTKFEDEQNIRKTNELTTEKLRTYKGFESISEEEAAASVDAIRKLAKILFYLYLNEEKRQTKQP